MDSTASLQKGSRPLTVPWILASDLCEHTEATLSEVGVIEPHTLHCLQAT